MDWIEKNGGGAYSSVVNFFAAVDTSDESFPAPLNDE